MSLMKLWNSTGPDTVIDPGSNSLLPWFLGTDASHTVKEHMWFVHGRSSCLHYINMRVWRVCVAEIPGMDRYVCEGMAMDRRYCLYYLGKQFSLKVAAVKQISVRRKVEWAMTFSLPTHTALLKQVLEPLFWKCCTSLDWSGHYISAVPYCSRSH